MAEGFESSMDLFEVSQGWEILELALELPVLPMEILGDLVEESFSM